MKGINTGNEPGVYRTKTGKKIKVESELLRINGLHSPTWTIADMEKRARTGISRAQGKFANQDEIISAMKIVANNLEPDTEGTFPFNSSAIIVTYDTLTNTYSQTTGGSKIFAKIYKNGEVHMFPKQ